MPPLKKVAPNSGHRRPAWPVLAASIACLLAGAAQASQFNVSPVKLTLQARAKSASVTVSNTGQKPLAVRVRLYTWDKLEGSDRLRPAEDLVVAPPIVRLEPGRSQIIRVGRPAEIAVPQIEKSYRLVVTELPLPREQPPETKGLALRSLLEVSVPLFVPPANPSRKLDWSVAAAGAEGALQLLVRNSGTVHSKLTRLRLQDGGGQTIAESATLLYALPQQQASVTLSTSRALSAGEPLRLEYTADNAARVVELKAPGR